MIKNSFFQNDIFKGLARVRISEKKDGDFRPNNSDEFRKKMRHIREDLNVHRIIAPVPGHGGNVIIDSNEDLIIGPAGIYRTKIPADGYIITTQAKSTAIMYAVADCPIAIVLAKFTTKHYAMGALHCGWKSLADGILNNFVNKLKFLQLGAVSMRANVVHSMRVLITPGIGDCCFVVDRATVDRLSEQFNEAYFVNKKKWNGRIRVDLSKICWQYFQEGGAEDVYSLRICTKCGNRFFSHRAGDTERNVVVVAFSPQAYPKDTVYKRKMK